MTDTTNETQVEVTQDRPDTFNGDNAKLIECIDALLDLDDAKALVPHGLGKGSHAYVLLNAARHRIQAEKRNNALAVEAENLRYIETVMAEAQEALCGNGEVCIDASGNDTLHIARGHLSRILAQLEGDE